MKILFLTSNSMQNYALSHMIAKQHELVGIIYENRFSKKSRLRNFLRKIRYNPFTIIKKGYQKYALRWMENDLQHALNKNFGHYSFFHQAPLLEVSNINQRESIEFIRNTAFDLIVVSGTQIVKKDILSQKPRYGIINMHTGLSPYYNGGPSCTFWNLYNEDIYHIGATVMYIDSGIDTGNIILSDTIKCESHDTYGSLEAKAIQLGNNLVTKAIDKIISKPGFIPVKQLEIGKGLTYYNRDFIFGKRIELQKKLKSGMIKRLINEFDFQKNDKITRIQD